MKKARFLMLCGLVALLLLSACATGVPEIPEAATTDRPETTEAAGLSSPEIPSDAEIKPTTLEVGEMFFPQGQTTFTELEELFGPLEPDLYACYVSSWNVIYLYLNWIPQPHEGENEVLVLVYANGEDFSFYDQELFSDGASHAITLSEEDMKAPLRAAQVMWSHADLSTPRGITVGMTLEEVQAAYPDAVYVQFDQLSPEEAAVQPYPDTVDSFLCAYTVPASALVINGAYVQVNKDIDYYEYATFYFKDGILVSMEQGCGGTTFRP